MFAFSPHNVPSFRACCSLLASLSGYQYTRRAWKKDVMELLLDLNFFQMDITCIGSWRTIIDNLMTQDNTSFKELMTMVAGLSKSASISLFANREQVRFLFTQNPSTPSPSLSESLLAGYHFLGLFTLKTFFPIITLHKNKLSSLYIYFFSSFVYQDYLFESKLKDLCILCTDLVILCCH